MDYVDFNSPEHQKLVATVKTMQAMKRDIMDLMLWSIEVHWERVWKYPLYGMPQSTGTLSVRKDL